MVRRPRVPGPASAHDLPGALNTGLRVGLISSPLSRATTASRTLTRFDVAAAVLASRPWPTSGPNESSLGLLAIESPLPDVVAPVALIRSEPFVQLSGDFANRPSKLVEVCVNSGVPRLGVYEREERGGGVTHEPPCGCPCATCTRHLARPLTRRHRHRGRRLGLGRTNRTHHPLECIETLVRPGFVAKQGRSSFGESDPWENWR